MTSDVPLTQREVGLIIQIEGLSAETKKQAHFIETLSAEVDRLRAVLRQTHSTHCDEAWTSRGKHYFHCLAYEVEE